MTPVNHNEGNDMTTLQDYLLSLEEAGADSVNYEDRVYLNAANVLVGAFDMESAIELASEYANYLTSLKDMGYELDTPIDEGDTVIVASRR